MFVAEGVMPEDPWVVKIPKNTTKVIKNNKILGIIRTVVILMNVNQI